MSFVALLLLLGLTVSTAWAGDRPIVAIFGVDAAKAKLSQDLLDQLPDYLATKLTESGKYQVIPREQVKNRLSAEKKKTYKKCYDQSCQIEIGKELAAEKTLSTKIMKLGSSCTVTLTLYDIRRATTESAASQHGGCKADEVVESMDKALGKLFGENKEARIKSKAEERERLAKVEVERKSAGEEEKGIAKRTEATQEVRQPGTNIYWLRCPLGQIWSGSSCQGERRSMPWADAIKACPAGYRLPTRQEFANLLGGCDENARGGGYGYCASCGKSSMCSSMFGKDRGFYWSSSSLSGDSSLAWLVGFPAGNVGISAGKDDGHDVRCVRIEI
ncbi:MAG: DUF1566 domain-containing protein [Deltaproteobacteria bacterium]|nr:DUF1566 domain-containing protein [Deltaproteobacteria bacterium]